MKKKRNFKGEGTFYFSKTQNRWVGQFVDENTGKRITVSDVDELTAKKKLREARVNAATGKYTKRSTISIIELGQEMIDLKYESNIITPSTYKRDLDTLNIIRKSNIGNISVGKITRMQLQDFFNKQKEYSNSVIKMLYQVLNQIFKEAILREILVKNPLETIVKPRSVKNNKKIRAFTVEEHSLFVNSEELKNSKYRNAFLTLINTGMRAGECLSLRPEDIDFKNGTCTINGTVTRDETGGTVYKDGAKTSNGIHRQIPCDTKQMEVFRSALQTMTINSHHAIFTYRGKIIAVSALNTVFKNIISKLRREALAKDPHSTLFESGENDSYLSLHSLRHTFATRCIEAGMPAHVLQKILGHYDVSITLNTYTDVFQKYKDEEFKKVLEYRKIHNL